MCHHVFTILAMMKLIALFSSCYEKNHTNMKKSLKNIWMLCTNCCTFALQTKK